MRNPLILALTVALAAVLATRASAQPVLSVKTDLRIGSDTGMTSFSDIRGIAVAPGGNILVLDFKAQEIRVFDAKGRFVRLAARKGSGPGEISNANGMATAPDGATWVNDPGSARLSIYGGDGRFLRQVAAPTWGYSYVWGAAFDTEGRLVEPFNRPVPGSNTMSSYWLRFNRAGEVRDTLPWRSCPPTAKPPESFQGMDATGRPMSFYGVPFQPRGLTALGHTAAMWCSAADTYVIYRFSLERSDTLAVIRSNAPRPPVTAEERKDAIAKVDSFFKKYPKNTVDYSRIPQVKPALAKMFVDDLDHLWVQRTPLTPEAPSEFDVWDVKGKLIGIAKLDFKLNTAISPVIVGDYLYAAILDADEVPTVVRAKIVLMNR